jgi:hypothetical protein
MRREVGRGDRALHVAIPSTYKTLIVASWREEDVSSPWPGTRRLLRRAGLPLSARAVIRREDDASRGISCQPQTTASDN